MTAQNKKNIKLNSTKKSKLNKEKVKKVNEKKKDNNIIFAYSALEQKRHNISSPIDSLMFFLKVFPFIILGTDLYSCFVKKLSAKEYKRTLLIAGGVLIAWLIINVVLWINRIFYVYMLDENHNFYRLRISNFWYKIRNQSQLMNPYDMVSGRLMRLFYMISNIKNVLQNISDTITYDELIAMGKLDKICDITEVRVTQKKIHFVAKVLNRDNQSGVKTNVSICRVYENDKMLIDYLKDGMPGEAEKVSDIILELKGEKTPLKKTIQFTLAWSCLVAWFAVIILSGDFSKLASINAGEYVKTVIHTENGIEKEVYMSVHNEKEYFAAADYGNIYKPIIVVYIFIEIVYVINRLADILVKHVIKNKDEQE